MMSMFAEASVKTEAEPEVGVKEKNEVKEEKKEEEEESMEDDKCDGETSDAVNQETNMPKESEGGENEGMDNNAGGGVQEEKFKTIRDTDFESPFFKYFPEKDEKNYPLPTHLSVKQIDDHMKIYYKGRTVNLFPMEITDLSRPEILSEVDKCVHFSMTYYRDNSENWAGRLLLQYKKAEDAQEAKSKLKFSEEINVMGSLSPQEEIKANKSIHKLPSETVNAEWLLYVAPLPIDITTRELSEVFPDADDFIVIRDEAKAANTANDIYKDPPCFAFLAYPNKKETRNAAIKYYDPEEEITFHGQVCFVSPAVAKDDDILLNVIRRRRRKFYLRTYDHARRWLAEKMNTDELKTKSSMKHCRYHYNRMLLDEEARRVLCLPLLEPKLSEFIPDVNKEIWKEKPKEKPKVFPTKYPQVPVNAAVHGGRGGMRGGRRMIKSPGGYQYQPRGKSGYALGANMKPERPARPQSDYGRGRATRGQGFRSPGWEDRKSGEEDTPRGWGRGRGRGLGMGASLDVGMGMSRGLGMEELPAYGDRYQMGPYTKEAGYGIGRPPVAQQSRYQTSAGYDEDIGVGGWGGGYSEAPEPAYHMPKPKKAGNAEGLLRKLSNLLEGLDEGTPEPAPRGFGAGGYGYQQSYGRGFKRPMGGEGEGIGYKRPRGGMGGGQSFY